MSATTVSVVVNGRQREARISDETVQRVWRAVQQYGYQPDHAARSLRRRATQLIGVSLSWLEDPFYPELSAAIGRACRQHGYGVFLTDLPDWVQDSTEHELGNIGVDGVILADTRRSPWHPGGKVVDPARSRLPTVMIMGQEWLVEWQLPVNSRRDPHIVVLQTELAGRLAARHLWERGYRRFVYVPGDVVPNLRPGDREYGFYDELRRLGARQPDAVYLVPPVPRLAGEQQGDSLPGYQEAQQVVASSWWPASPSERVGFYAVNDSVAVQVLRALHEAGVLVPGQAGVVGTNGSQLGVMAFPPLTTISLNVDAVAQEAVRRLLRLISGGAEDGSSGAPDSSGGAPDSSGGAQDSSGGAPDSSGVTPDGSGGAQDGSVNAAGDGQDAGSDAAPTAAETLTWPRPSLLTRGST